MTAWRPMDYDVYKLVAGISFGEGLQEMTRWYPGDIR